MNNRFNSKVIDYKENGGLFFYEKDSLKLSDAEVKNINLSLDIEYFSNGFGFLFESDNESYLIILLNGCISVHSYSNGILMDVYKEAIDIYTPLDLMNVKLTKSENNINIVFNNDILTSFYYMLPYNYSSSSYSIYSNAGNSILKIESKEYIPTKWQINSIGSQGFVSFIKDGFSVNRCSRNIEIIQNNIDMSDFIDNDILYLSFESDGDIKVYLYNKNDLSIIDEDKNVLHEIENGKLYSFKKSDIIEKYAIIKFESKNCTVKNISISSNISQKYFRTSDIDTFVKPSKFCIRSSLSNSLSFYLKINSYNEKSIFLDGVRSISEIFPETSLSSIYIVNVNFSTMTCTITNRDSGSITAIQIKEIDNNVILYNCDAKVFNIKTDKDIIEDNTKKYISRRVKSPIIAIDGSNELLNLSSSYRKYKDDKNTYYKFCNVEREFFTSFNKPIKLQEKILKSSLVNIYGIINDGIDCVNEDNFDCDNIEDLGRNVVKLNNEEIIVIDYDSSTIMLSVDDNKYKEIIIEYEKDNSYCINIVSDNLFEVCFSTSSNEYSIVYDYNNENDTYPEYYQLNGNIGDGEFLLISDEGDI